VFRYALENWRPDPYVAYVLHEGELTAEQQGLLDTLRSKDLAGTVSANLIVKTVDLAAEPDEVATQLREENAGVALPCLVVQTPAKRGQPQTVFSAELTSANVVQLVDSPLRSKVKDRLLNGDSVVWVYLESGVHQVDDEAFAMLTQELDRLQGELKLPEIEEEDLKDLTAAPESLKIQFSAVRLARDDVRESAFRDMLLHVEHDLLDEPYLNQSMAFPIFGRGRALYALVGDGLAPDLVEEACRFLTGACQCTVKAENPGVDILMQVEWDKFIQPTEAVDATLPPLAGFSGFGQGPEGSDNDVQVAENTSGGNDDSAPIPPQSAEPDSDEDSSEESAVTEVQAVSVESTVDSSLAPAGSVWKNATYVLLLAGGAVAVATLFLMRRSSG
jgi:hypothetical protein